MKKFFEIFEKVNKVKLNENYVGDNPTELRYKYDQKGNWIPVGYEDKRMGIRPVEQPLGSGNEKFLVVLFDEAGEDFEILRTKDSWEEAKADVLDSIT